LKALKEMPMTPIFGTYRLKGPILVDAANQAMWTFRKRGFEELIDCAAKYQNLTTIREILASNPAAKLGWKVEQKRTVHTSKALHTKTISHGLAYVADLKDRLFRILLHNWVDAETYGQFVSAVREQFGPDMPLGICNVSVEQLQELAARNLPVDIVQNEFHPWLSTAVPQYCSEHGIRFEAHSVFTNLPSYAQFLNEELTGSFSAAALAIQYALRELTPVPQTQICFTTTNFVHLSNNLDYLQAPMSPSSAESTRLLNFLKGASTSQYRFARYYGADTEAIKALRVGPQGKSIILNDELMATTDEAVLRNYLLSTVYPLLRADLQTLKTADLPSRLVLELPKKRRGGNARLMMHVLAELVACDTNPNSFEEEKQYFLRKMLKKRQQQGIEQGIEQQQITEPDELKPLSSSAPAWTSAEIKRVEVIVREKWQNILEEKLKVLRRRLNGELERKKKLSKQAADTKLAVVEPDALPMMETDYPPAHEFADFCAFLSQVVQGILKI
jgi:diketogulonate reductase-like aldo/keto reductase